MTQSETQMRREILEIPDAVERLLREGRADINAAAQSLRDLDPSYLMTVARGSSDHVATYLKYVSELLLGVPVASVGPSVASIYGARLKAKGCACISISQSGQSPDIVEMARQAGEDGALTLAITNKPDSPLALVSDHTLNIHAGPELSVAATKTFVTSAVAGLVVLAQWKGDAELLKAIDALPEHLEKAVAADWSAARQAIAGRDSLFCLGRGPAIAISNEAALKFKETCQVHAESYSSAEVLHGPVSIVADGFPIIALTSDDAATQAVADVADQVAEKGAAAFATTARVKHATALPVIRTGHPLADPLCLIASFYSMVEQEAVSRGIDPDTPRHLKKVTETR